MLNAINLDLYNLCRKWITAGCTRALQIVFLFIILSLVQKFLSRKMFLNINPLSA